MGKFQQELNFWREKTDRKLYVFIERIIVKEIKIETENFHWKEISMEKNFDNVNKIKIR